MTEWTWLTWLPMVWIGLEYREPGRRVLAGTWIRIVDPLTFDEGEG